MNNRSKILFITFAIILSSLFIFFSYKSYNAYKAYKISQSSDKYIAFLYRGDSLLQKLENEKLLSAYYLGNNGEIDFQKLKNIRHETDEILRNSKKLIQINPDFLKNLQYVRSRVDVISDDYNDILFKYYQNELLDVVLKQMINHIQELSLGAYELKNKLKLYKEFLIYKNRVNSKNSFILYILARSQKLNNNDLLTLDHLINEIKSPLDNSINDDFNTKLQIVKGVDTGNFGITSKEWLDRYTKKMDSIIKSKKEIFYQIQSRLKKMVSSPQYLINNVVFALFFLISTIFVLKKIFEKNTNTLIIQKDRRKSSRNNSNNDDEKYIVLKYNEQGDKEINTSNEEEIKFSKTAIRSFNPQQKFTNIVNILKEESDKRDIGFKYKIDQDIPITAIGNVSKIDDILNLLINYILKSSSSNNFITFDAENLAQTKVENAIKLSFSLSNLNMKNISTKDDLTLLKVKKLSSLIGGTFKVEKSEDLTKFIVTINLKKGS